MPTIELERLSGTCVEPHIEALAQLRIAVFREYPYLYEGSLAYEQHYLEEFARCARSTLVIAREGEHLVGAATAMPLLEHGEQAALASALAASGIPLEAVYYLGESVLLRPYRGRGLGHAFFEQRELAARALGFAVCVFCAVVRDPGHPLEPTNYRSHDEFWTRRGYLRRPDLCATFRWLDREQTCESDKSMVFWLKELAQ